MAGPINHLLEPSEIAEALAVREGWAVVEGRLRKRFVLSDFPSALAFMVEAGFAAERLDHHPNWSNVYNRVDVELWSHDLGGISRLCLDLAVALDRVYTARAKP